MLSPSRHRTRAPRMSAIGPGVRGMSSKYGARRIYVEFDSHAKRSPAGTGRPRQRSSPANTSPYSLWNIADLMDERTRSSTSLADGQMSRRRSEEHTSELQSLAYLVCRLLLEKKKTLTRPAPYRSVHSARECTYPSCR